MECDMIIQMYKRVSKASYFSNVNYTPYLLVLEKKLIEYGFTKFEIAELDKEICEKVEYEISDPLEQEGGKRRRKLETIDSEEIFHPFSTEEMRNLMLQLWKGQLESTNRLFKKHHSELRLVLIQKAIRDTLVAFFGHTIRKDQSIWIGREIHALYLKEKSSLR